MILAGYLLFFLILGENPASSNYCSKWDASPVSFDRMYLVPVLASSKWLSQWEENIIYDINKDGMRLFLQRTIELNRNCFYHQQINVNVEHNTTSISSRPIRTPSCLTSNIMPTLNLTMTGILFRKELDIFVLISCDRDVKNITVAVGCFAYWSVKKSFDWTKRVQDFLIKNNVDLFLMHRIDARKKLWSHFELKKLMSKNRGTALLEQNCTLDIKWPFEIHNNVLYVIIFCLSTFFIILFYNLRPAVKVRPLTITSR